MIAATPFLFYSVVREIVVSVAFFVLPYFLPLSVLRTYAASFAGEVSNLASGGGSVATHQQIAQVLKLLKILPIPQNFLVNAEIISQSMKIYFLILSLIHLMSEILYSALLEMAHFLHIFLDELKSHLLYAIFIRFPFNPTYVQGCVKFLT